MPGPGGGPHSGGGGYHGGGGGPHGGGFGGPRPPHGGRMHEPSLRRMYRGGWYRRPRYYGRGGCLGCMFVVLLIPVITVAVVSMLFFF